MDTLTNLKAFLAVARTGSFAAAARELKVAPSVVTKRIGQLEWRLKAGLFERSTRRVGMTATGLRYLASVQRIVADVDELFAELPAMGRDLQGRLRIKAPGTLAVHLLGPLLERFQALHPLVSIELLTLDRPVNPVDEGFDVVLTLMPDAFAGVVEQPLCPMQRILCASPAYLEGKGTPAHPSDLARHDILNFLPTGTQWTFEGAAGEVLVRVHPRLDTNEGQLLLSSALAGHGIARLGAYLCDRHVRAGALVPLLPGYTIKPLWLRALVPDSRIQVARVQALVQWLKDALEPAGTAGEPAQG
ncbi:LysR family transcriptional regulator [Pseudorhodoferax sp.]|uniref:LysR family transcriptional regulator n=1 Tax=Pseudorhodoferax sp. TaxID=1993553 RepID=UPI0039E4BA86